jgi:EmrB/QacA subfamily drug resistance transporter
MGKKFLDTIESKSEEFSIKEILPPLIAIIMAMLLVILDSTIMNVAILNLESSFQTDLKTIQWAITGYTLALSVVIPLAGWFSDRFTSKKIILISIFLFTAFSVLCSIAKTPMQLILFRVFQGLGGGMISPISMAISFKLAPPDKRGSIMGILGFPMLAAPIAGPVLSGWILSYASWNWIFLINLPIGIIALILGIKYLPESNSGKGFKLDILGAIFAPLSFFTIIYGVHNGSSERWTNISTIISLIIGSVSLGIFIFIELRKSEPLLELRSFSSIEFTKGMVITCLNWTALFGSTLLIPLYLQQIRGFSSFESGLFIIPQAIMSFIGMQIGGRLFDKYGVRPVVFTGLLLLSSALICLSGVQIDTNIYLLIGYFSLAGLGQGLTTMQLSTHVLKSTPEKLISRVTPLTASAQQIFGSFAVAIMSGLLTSNIQKHMVNINVNLQRAQIQAMAAGFQDTFVISLVLAILALITSVFLRDAKAKKKQVSM